MYKDIFQRITITSQNNSVTFLWVQESLNFLIPPKWSELIDAFCSELKNIVNNAKYITVVFIFLRTLCSLHLIMTDTYIDYLDFGETPPKDSQYWVAPFVERFVKDNIRLIDKSCLDYLKDYTFMQFNF